MIYKKDTIIGTWVAISVFIGCMFAALLHFEQLTTRPEAQASDDCDVCLWTNP